MKDKALNLGKTAINTLLKKIYFPKQEKLERTVESFSSFQKILFFALSFAIITSSIFLLAKVNSKLKVEVPRSGGEIREGVIGSPRFINPLLARSKADIDLSALVYSGLMKMSGNGEMVPDLAKSYSVSEDKLTYTFKLRGGISFHDGEEVTADDVIYTIEKAKDPALESAKRANWDGMEVAKIDEKTLTITLKQPYSPFIKNTDLGILPEHIWGSIPSKQFSFSRFNVEPIGSGPFKVSNIKRDSSGIPESYELKRFKKFTLGKPFIKEFSMRFYPSQEKLIEGYKNGEINQFHSISARETIENVKERDSKIASTPLPRVFALFYNQNKSDIFTDYEMRAAIDAAINKKGIVEKIFAGFAEPISSPIPHWILKQSKVEEKPLIERLEKAKELIAGLSWTYDKEDGLFKKQLDSEEKVLSFSITTSNTPELKETARLIKSQLKKVGIQVDIEIFEKSDLNRNVIRPRDYEVLLFGEVIGPGLDLYSFWHSSRQNDPGLNMAMYANIEIDNLLEKARKELNKEKRLEILRSISEKISSEKPASFLFAPHFTYVLRGDIKGVAIKNMADQKDRFMNVSDWYTRTENIWRVFKNKRR